MEIKVDDLNSGAVISLLEEHLRDMYATSPADSVHALDREALKGPDITFFSAWKNGQLAGCVVIKKLNDAEAEIKSMRTSHVFRHTGVATSLLKFLIEFAQQQKYKKLNLETGTQEYFNPARNLYKKFSFRDCGSFGSYRLNENSHFMTRDIIHRD